MEFGEKIKHIRVQSLLSQEAFAKELGVSYSTVNRWEKDKTKPNYLALKSIDNFCKIHKISFDISEYALEVHII